MQSWIQAKSRPESVYFQLSIFLCSRQFYWLDHFTKPHHLLNHQYKTTRDNENPFQKTSFFNPLPTHCSNFSYYNISMLKSKQAALQNKTIVHPAPAPLSTDYLDRINQTPASERSEIENHVHDVINEFESGVGRKATQAEVASIISSVTNHTAETIEDTGDSDMDYDGDHNHDSIAKKQVKLLTENSNLSLAEDELALAEAQFEMMSKQLSLAADLHGDEKRRDSMLSEMNGLNEDRYVHEVNEGLGEDYRDSPWLMPSVAKALQHRRYAMFASGHAPLCRTGQHDLASFGSGIALYLKFLKALSICFTVMTVLSLPAYFFATAGSKIAVEDRDAFGFGMIR